MKYSSPAAFRLLLEGSAALARVEAAGFRVDLGYVDATTAKIEGMVKDLDAEVRADAELWRAWRRAAGGKMKPTAGGQLQAALKALGYTFSGAKTKTGEDKSDKEELGKVDRPAVRAFLKAKNLRNTVTTYFGQIKRECVRHADGHHYVHTDYNLYTAATYRPVSRDPNLANIPKREEQMMRFVRKAYLPLPGHHLAEPDFDTHEVRVGYTYNHDPVMERYLLNPESDMHRDTAAEMFMVPVETLKEHAKAAKLTLRHSAKNQFVFAEFFGSVWFNCAPKIWESMVLGKWKLPGTDTLLVDHLKTKGITGLGSRDDREPARGTFLHHIREVERKLWDRFKVYAQWKKDYFARYQRDGYFAFHTGFVVSTPHGKNDVVNYPIQGAAFHCLLQCIIWLVGWLERKNMRSRVIGQVYDCIILSVHPKELQDVLAACKYVMTVKLPQEWKWINIPFQCETDVAGRGEPWSELKTWEETNQTWHLKV